MKTIQEWFEELEEPYRSQAIKNTKKHILTSEVRSLRGALSGAFVWKESPQKDGYWRDLYYKTNKKQNQNDTN